MEEYIVIKKSNIDAWIKSLKDKTDVMDEAFFDYKHGKAQEHILNMVLLMGKPLQPIVEKAFESGVNYGNHESDVTCNQYINNFKI